MKFSDKQAHDRAQMVRSEQAVLMLAVRRFECVHGFPMAISQTGAEYDEIKCSGSTVEAALCEFVLAFDKYASGKSGRIYWRLQPELAADTTTDSEGYTFYARLLISDAPVKWATLNEYNVWSAART